MTMTTNPTFPVVRVTRDEMLASISDAYKGFYGFRPKADTYERAATWDNHQLRAWLKFLGCEWISKEEWEHQQEQLAEHQDWLISGERDWS